MKMLRWSCGRTKLDKIRNEDFRKRMKVTEISKKVQEKSLKWYGHVVRREDEHINHRVFDMKVEGMRAKGRPKTCCQIVSPKI